MKTTKARSQDWQRLKTEGWHWWYPQERPAFIIAGGDGAVLEVLIGPTLGADEVICDFCNAWVDIRPVPALGSYAACPECFQRLTGIRVEEAASLDGIDVQEIEE